jgi:tetratricopeptide (TPR) repeat protein
MLQSKIEPDQSPEAARAAAEARAAADSGDWNAARAAMAKAIDVSPNDPALHAHMAWYSHQASSLPDFERERLTEHHLSVALEIDPNNAEAHYVQGLLWSGGGNTTRARIALSTALKLRPDYHAAAHALERLDKVDEPPPDAATPGSLMPRQRGSKLRTALLVGCAVLSLAGAGAYFFSTDASQYADLGKQLGTRYAIVSASRVGEDLHMDVGESWEKIPADERSTELTAMAQHAGGMGLVNIFVYTNSQPVAETHADKICLGPCPPPPPRPGSPPPAPTPPSHK